MTIKKINKNIKITAEQQKELDECINLMEQPNRWRWVIEENQNVHIEQLEKIIYKMYGSEEWDKFGIKGMDNFKFSKNEREIVKNIRNNYTEVSEIVKINKESTNG